MLIPLHVIAPQPTQKLCFRVLSYFDTVKIARQWSALHFFHLAVFEYAFQKLLQFENQAQPITSLAWYKSFQPTFLNHFISCFQNSYFLTHCFELILFFVLKDTSVTFIVNNI